MNRGFSLLPLGTRHTPHKWQWQPPPPAAGTTPRPAVVAVEAAATDLVFLTVPEARDHDNSIWFSVSDRKCPRVCHETKWDESSHRETKNGTAAPESTVQRHMYYYYYHYIVVM